MSVSYRVNTGVLFGLPLEIVLGVLGGAVVIAGACVLLTCLHHEQICLL
jgi:hypothetical protein